MIRPTIPLALILAACATDLPPEVAQGALSHGGRNYPVVSRGDLWFVKTDRGPVQCRAATQEDCYWSLRAALLAQTAPDLMG